MKKVAFTILIAASLFATGDMPPMPPMSGQSAAPQAPNLPKECSTLPPMIIFLPPPMEIELNACKNILAMPKIENAKESLQKMLNTKSVEIKSISSVEGFKELYSIKYTLDKKGQELYCNGSVTSCFYPKPITKK